MVREIIVAESGAGDIAAQPLSQVEIVESLMADGLREIKKSVDVLFFNPTGMDERTNALATRTITAAEVDGVLNMLHGIADIGLIKRHRMARGVLRQMSKRLRKNGLQATTGKSWDILAFGNDLVGFLTTMHYVLAESTPARVRTSYYWRFYRGQALPK